jgi:hypothetical protein
MKTARDIMAAAEARADTLAREWPMVIAVKACGKCKGSGAYQTASGPADCNACRNGLVPANAGARELWMRELVAVEVRRLRVLWAGARDALAANPSKSQRWELEHTMRAAEARAAAVKANPRMIAHV